MSALIARARARLARVTVGGVLKMASIVACLSLTRLALGHLLGSSELVNVLGPWLTCAVYVTVAGLAISVLAPAGRAVQNELRARRSGR